MDVPAAEVAVLEDERMAGSAQVSKYDLVHVALKG